MLKLSPNTTVYCGLRSPNKDFVLRAVGDPAKIDISNALDRNADGKQMIFKGLIKRELFLPIPECFSMFMEEFKAKEKDGLPMWEHAMMDNDNPYFNWGKKSDLDDPGCTALTVSLLYDFYMRLCQVDEPLRTVVQTVLTMAPWFQEKVIQNLNDWKWELTAEEIKESLKEGLKNMVNKL